MTHFRAPTSHVRIQMNALDLLKVSMPHLLSLMSRLEMKSLASAETCSKVSSSKYLCREITLRVNIARNKMLKNSFAVFQRNLYVQLPRT